MSNDSLPPLPRHIGPRPTIEIVASEFNRELVDGLLSGARAELNSVLPEATVNVNRVPGAYEIPVCVASILQASAPAAVIALGIIIRGETAHADLIAAPIFSSLQDLAIQHRVPVINEVLLLDSVAQAQARQIRGTDAARAAIKMINVIGALKSHG